MNNRYDLAESLKNVSETNSAIKISTGNNVSPKAITDTAVIYLLLLHFVDNELRVAF
jgi:hypothetical protein